MNGWQIFEALAGLATFYGLALALRTERRQLLTFDFTYPLALAKLMPHESDNRISLVYDRDGADPVSIKGAYLTFVRVANLGKEPIRRDDLAGSDHPRLSIQNSRILDWGIAGCSREVINFSLSPADEGNECNNTFLLGFDFLDYQDGVLIRFMTDGPPNVSLQGTVIGMPKGIPRFDQLRGVTFFIRRSPFRIILALMIPGAFISWPAAQVFADDSAGFRQRIVWLAVFLIVPTVIAIVGAKYLVTDESDWPKALRLPNWFRGAQMDQRTFG
jgi:hypothetical protein